MRRLNVTRYGWAWWMGLGLALSVTLTTPVSFAKDPHPSTQHRQSTSDSSSHLATCPRHYWSTHQHVLACPNVNGTTLLPAHYPPRTLFVGYDPEPRYLSFLSTLIAHNKKRPDPLQLVFLIPRLELQKAYRDLKPYMDRPEAKYLMFLPAPSDETLWTQDYLEIGISMQDGRGKIIDLPYANREGDEIPAALALSCQLELISQANPPSEDPFPQRGDYGGNIEALPGNLLLVGNSMTAETRKRLQSALPSMTTLEVDVNWLSTGHVDELFTVIPNAAPNATCPFAMAYASPKLALALVRKHGFDLFQNRILPEPDSSEDVSPELKDGTVFSGCLSAYAQRQMKSERCHRLIAANRHYDQIIERDRQRIHRALLTRDTCSQITWIAVPQLFTPSYEVWLDTTTWGTPDDSAQAVNPNAVNVIALGTDLIIPWQTYPPFNHEISHRLAPLGLNLVRVDSAFSHFLNGGLHCNTSVARMCRPQSNIHPSSLQSSRQR